MVIIIEMMNIKHKVNKMDKKYKSSDLVYQFNFIDGVQIQTILMALNTDYELKSITSVHGVVEFVLSKKGGSNV